MLVRQAARDTAGRTAPSASAPQSWESPAQPLAANANDDPQLIKGSLTVASVAAFVRRNGMKIISLALILFTLGFFVLSIIPVRYAATALVVVDPREQRVTAEQDVLPGIGQDSAALQSLIEIAKSDGFLRPLIEQLKVADDDEIANGEKDISRLLDKFRSRLDISRRGLTYVIAMTFVSKNPELAARYANAVAEAFVASLAQVHTEATDDAAGFLNSRLKTLSDRLRASEDAVAAFKADHRIVNAGRESTTRQLRVTELSQQVSAARLRAEEAKNRYEQAQRDLKANVDGPSGSRTDLLNLLRAQRTQLNDQIAQKRAVLGDRHPDLVISVNQLNELNRQIEIERRRTIDSAKSDYQTVLDQQKSLESQLKSLEGDMLVDGQGAVKLQELQRDADANRNIYEQFLSRFRTTSEQRLLQTSQAKVVSPATAPTRPTRPPLALILAALAIGALLSSAAIITLLEAVGGSAKEASEEPIADPGPVASGDDKSVWHATTLREGAAELGSRLRELLDTIAVMPGQRGKVVLVTSGENGVGKSAVARSLNALAVERGMLSVLIEVLSEQALLRAKQGPGDDGVTNPARALRTDARSVNLLLDTSQNVAVAAFPGDVRTEFNLIVIDAPALTEQSDVAAILAHADFTILVARDSATDAGAINKAKAALSRFGNSLIGIVINKADDKADSWVATAR
jgi:polysaccharide biosynthesis transport protein